IAGAIGAGGTAGVGVGNTDLIHSATVMAFIGHDADVSAGGAGLTVSATTGEDVLTIAAAGAVGGTAGVAGSAAVNVFDETTTAYIGHDTTITMDPADKASLAAGAKNLMVTAADDTKVISVAGELAAGGSAGGGVGADVGVYSKHTKAFIY